MIRSRDSIGFGLGPANPDAFFTALGEREDWEDLRFGGALLLGYYTVLAQPGVSYRCGFFGPAERILLAGGPTSSWSRGASASSPPSCAGSPRG